MFQEYNHCSFSPLLINRGRKEAKMRGNKNKGLKQPEKKMRSTTDLMTTTGCAPQIRKIISPSSGSPWKCKVNGHAGVC